MKISIAEVKRRLPVGTEYVGEFCGEINTRVISNTGTGKLKPTTDRLTRRIVRRQGNEMVSEFLTGSKSGQPIHLPWKGVTARDDGESIVLSQLDHKQESEDFLRITL